MSDLPTADAEADTGPETRGGARRHLRTVAGLLVAVAVVALAAVAVLRDRREFSDALAQMGWGTVLLSALAGVAGVAFTFPLWLSTLGGLGAHLPFRTAMVTFFVSQLGKYLPGSVWPVVAQMEAGRSHGVNRRTMLSGNLLTLVINLVVGSTIACVLLPLGSPSALHRFWWLFLALPALLPLLHPRVLPAALDKLFALAHRPPLGERLDPRSTVIAAGWGTLSWVSLGAHIGILCAGLGHDSVSVFVTSTGAMALAVSVGILFIPAPAGAGLREVALLLALSSVVSDKQGLAIVIVSRVTMIVVDLVLAALAALLGVWLRSTARL